MCTVGVVATATVSTQRVTLFSAHHFTLVFSALFFVCKCHCLGQSLDEQPDSKLKSFMKVSKFLWCINVILYSGMSFTNLDTIGSD